MKDSVINGEDARIFYDKQKHYNAQKYDATRVYELIKPRSTLVDFGCGFGYLEGVIHKKVRHIFAIDESKAMIKQAKEHNYAKNITYMVGDAADSGLPSRSTDFVIMSFSLHHTSDKSKWLREAHRILKNDGSLIIIDRIAANRLAQLAFPFYWHFSYKQEHKWKEEMPKLILHDKIRELLKRNGFRFRSMKNLTFENHQLFKNKYYPRHVVVARKIETG